MSVDTGHRSLWGARLPDQHRHTGHRSLWGARLPDQQCRSTHRTPVTLGCKTSRSTSPQGTCHFGVQDFPIHNRHTSFLPLASPWPCRDWLRATSRSSNSENTPLSLEVTLYSAMKGGMWAIMVLTLGVEQHTNIAPSPRVARQHPGRFTLCSCSEQNITTSRESACLSIPTWAPFSFDGTPRTSGFFVPPAVQLQLRWPPRR